MQGQLRLPGELLGDLAPPAMRLEGRAEIARLRAGGLTTAEITRSLNNRGVPTPSGRGRWWDETVRRHTDPIVRDRYNAYMRGYRARRR